MIHAPSITGDIWLNSEPITKTTLEGKVVLVDFWTYSCVNCIRTFPYLQEWWEKYKDKGLIIIGIHTPEFDFEKDQNQVKQAIKKLGIAWPVVLDNTYANWNAFANRAWPAKYLIDKKGYIVYQHFGEGAYQETEQHIQSVLRKDSHDISMPEITDEHTHGKVCFLATPETYCGYNRGKLYDQDYEEDKEAIYNKPQDIPINSLSLQGTFYASSEYVEFRSEDSILTLHFTATEVNLVMSPGKEKTAIMTILFNGQHIEADIKGYDVTEGGEVIITEPRLYNLIKSNDLLDGTLTIQSSEGHPQAYAFTFSGCQE